jgi:hypothetical protein
MKTASIIAIAVLAGAASAQTGTLDQHSPWEGLAPPVQGASFNFDAAFLVWQAQIRAGTDGQLEGIEIAASQGDAGAQVEVRIRDGAAWSTAPALFETAVTKSVAGPEIMFVDMTSAGIELTEGDVFVMEANGTGTGVWLLGTYVPPASGQPPAYPEPLFLLEAPHGDGQWRVGFKTYMIEGGGCYPDCDGSGELDFFDFLCFQDAFAAGEPYADCDGSGSLDFFDFLCFQDEFAAGCP